jgi:hypothetical protein
MPVRDCRQRGGDDGRRRAGILPIGHCVCVGIPDEESWFRNSYIAMARPTGWRRRVLVIIYGIVAFTALAGAIVGVVARLT